jgi:hypothetical protein
MTVIESEKENETPQLEDDLNLVDTLGAMKMNENINENNRNLLHKPALSSLSRGIPSHYVTDIAASQIDKSVDTLQKDRFFRNKLVSQ